MILIRKCMILFVGVRGSLERHIFCRVREGEGVHHREISLFLLLFVLFCREASVPDIKAQQHLPLATSLGGGQGVNSMKCHIKILIPLPPPPER